MNPRNIPTVSVVVVAKNEEKTISKCLESLLDLDFAEDEYEVIIVDGASSDRTREICERHPVKLIRLDRGGISYQRNVGVAAAVGEYVAFADADCVVDRVWLRKLVDGIEAVDREVVAVGGPNLVVEDDPALSRVIGYAQQTFLGSGRSPQSYVIAKPSYVASIPNCNILYRKDVLAEEKYDESLSIGDDCELNFRLRQRGYKFLYLPDALVWHHRPSSFRGFAKKMFLYGVAVGRITRMHNKVIRWYAFLTALAVILLVLSYPIIRYLHPAMYVYGSVAFLYVLALAISTAEVYWRYRSVKSLATMVLVPLQHLLYGLGFMKGLLTG